MDTQPRNKGKYATWERCWKCEKSLGDTADGNYDWLEGDMACLECCEKAEKADELKAQYREECVNVGEHMKRLTSVGGYDVCYNCGSKE